jgi:hypothetical protein
MVCIIVIILGNIDFEVQVPEILLQYIKDHEETTSSDRLSVDTELRSGTGKILDLCPFSINF